MISREIRHSPAVVSVGRKESLLSKWIKDCSALNLVLQDCVEYVHNVKRTEELTALIDTNNKVGILLAEMLLSEARVEEAEAIANNIIRKIEQNNTSRYNNKHHMMESHSDLQYLEALSLLAQIYMHTNNKELSKDYCLALLSNPHILQSERLVLDITHIITQQELEILDEEIDSVLSHFKRVLETYHKTPDIVRMAKKWALPLWERIIAQHQQEELDPSSLKSSSSSPPSSSSASSPTPFLHPFILTLAKLEALASYPFEVYMRAVRKELLLGNTTNNNNNN